MTVIQTVRGPYGDVQTIPDVSLATYQAQGYVAIMPPYVSLPDDNGAWDTGPFYLIAHADGRRLAVTMDNHTNYYAPLGFTLVGLEIPNAIIPPGVTLLTYGALTYGTRTYGG